MKSPSSHAESFRLRGSRRAGAGRSARGGTAMQEPGRARVLHHPDRGEHAGGEPLQAADRPLKKKTGKKIEFYMPTSYSSVVEALLNGWVQLGVLGPESYVIAKSKDTNIEVFATYAKKRKGHLQEEGPGYRSVLITSKASGTRQRRKAQGQGPRLVEPASTSGDLVPRAVFAQGAQDPPRELLL